MLVAAAPKTVTIAAALLESHILCVCTPGCGGAAGILCGPWWCRHRLCKRRQAVH